MGNQLLTSKELARRWSLSATTLKQWRWHGRGPKHTKVGKRVLYLLKDVVQFEEQNVRQSTSQIGLNPLPAGL